jgi:hypothetical protein
MIVRLTMRILLDSRDLINLVERGQPISTTEFDAYLRSNNHQIVLCFTNVKEFAGALGEGKDFLELRPLLQSLESLPHICLKESAVIAVEIGAAVAAFNASTEYQGRSPYVRRWDYTLGGEEPVSANWVNVRIDEIVFDINRTRPDVFRPPAHHRRPFQRLFADDRVLLRAGKLPPKQHFLVSMRKHAASHHVQLPVGHEDEFAAWVYANPNRCPGLRLGHEVYRALLANYADIPETNDIFDIALVYAVPHVDAGTLDRRMRDYVNRASRKLVKMGATYNYRNRICDDVSDLMNQVP